MPWWRWISVVFVVAVTSCALAGIGWDETDVCGENGCTHCSRDSDCTTGSSCCAKELYCSHKDDAPNVCQLGCYAPDPPPCTCRGGRCRFE